MAEQVNEAGALSPQSMSQKGQAYSQAIRNMDVMDEMVIGGISTSPQRISSMDRTGHSLDSLAPIFPPQNFEVPDISFSNSVISSADFNQFGSGQMYSNANTVYTNVSTSAGSGAGEQQVGAGQQGHPNMGGQHLNSQQQVGFFPSASRSPTGTSSSDDSDDLPLAQLAKRVISANTSSHAGTNASLPSPSAVSTDTTSMEGSPISGVASKKGKQTKRKKKKDPNEPQKPVSAYALFFRDTQATIKGHNPSASFGEVSKIVASMWDQLDPEHKDVYKKKTEMAKKQYLKQLAAYRASQVSQSAPEEVEKSPSPSGVSIGAMSGSASFQGMSVVPSGSNMPVSMAVGQGMNQHRPHLQQQSPTHLMQVPSQMQQHMHQQHLLQQQQINVNQASPSHQQHLLQQQQINVNQASPSHQQHLLQQQQINVNQASPSHQHSPPQEMSGPVYTSPQHMGPNSYQQNMMDHNNAFGFSDQDVNMEMAYPHCVRSGCKNHARDNPAWDSEYCSNDCVITHCRDIFKNWVASRSGSNTYPVK